MDERIGDLFDAETLHDLSLVIGVLSMRRGATGQSAAALDIRGAADPLLLALAAFIEMDPDLDTPAKRREQIDDHREQLKAYLKKLAELRERTGLSLLHLLGAAEGKAFGETPGSTGSRH